MNYRYSYYGDTYQLQRWISTFWFVALALTVYLIVCMWKIFVKAGEEGWKCLIPIYNTYIETKIADYTQYFFFMLFGGLGYGVLAGIIAAIGGNNQATVVILGIVSLVFAIMAIYMSIKFVVRFAHAFGKTGAFAVGLIFLPLIFYGILAFGSAAYQWGNGPTTLKSDEVRAWQCPNCGSYNPVSRVTCEHCGNQRSEKDRIG